MARNDWDDNDDFENDSNLVKDLRKQLREAQKARDEAAAEISQLKTVTRATSLKEVLSAKQLNPKLAAFYPSDGEVTPEAVDAWVSQYADVFGVTTPEPDVQADPALDPAQAAAYLRMVAGDNAPGPQQNADAAARIASATSKEDLLKILQGG